jgi:hypothetical protein
MRRCAHTRSFDVRAQIALDESAAGRSVRHQEDNMHKVIKEMIKEIEANGYTVEQGRSHVLVKGKGGNGTVASLPLTPGRGRAIPNLRSQLHARGVLEKRVQK